MNLIESTTINQRRYCTIEKAFIGLSILYKAYERKLENTT